jgi:hypothetical protein
MWYDTFDGVFFMGVTASLIGLLGIVIKSCSSSRCEDTNCCFGLLKIHRNVTLEHDEALENLELQTHHNQNLNISDSKSKDDN